MPKIVEQLRKTEAEELTAHDIATLFILSGFCANPKTTPDAEGLQPCKLIACARGIADEFLIQKEVQP